MIKKIIHLLCVPISGALGYWLWMLTDMILKSLGIKPFDWVGATGVIVFISVFAVIGYFIGKPVSSSFVKMMHRITKKAKEMPTKEMFLCMAGLLFGFVGAFLLCQIFGNIDNVVLVTSINAVIYICCGVLGVRLALMHCDEIVLPLNNEKNVGGTVLDASILVDGRVCDIIKTGFMKKPVYIPKFVIDELSALADSEDTKKRTRGRMGLDAVKRLQNEFGATVVQKDYASENSSDDRIIAFAEELGCSIMTNDYSLNMVAGLQGVEILNINELVNALKPTVVAGENLHIEITKEGKEPSQGIGYLDDGTMVVIENGAEHINKTVETVVTGMLQTNSGKIIFAKLK